MINARERAEKLIGERRARMAAQRTSRALSGEENPTREVSISSPRNDVRVSPLMFGQHINRPVSGVLLRKGTKGFIYVSTDDVNSNTVLSVWNGAAWIEFTK